MKTQDQF